MVTLVRTLLSGAAVTGGGVATLAFEDPVDDSAALALLGVVDTFWSGVAANTANVVTFEVESNPSRYAASTGELQEVFDAASPGPVTGSVSTDAMPKASQVLIRWATADIVDGRVIRGRTYLPGIPGSQVTASGGLEPALAAIIQGHAATLISGSGGTLSVWHRPVSDGADPPVYSGGSSHLVTIASVWSQLAVLRSRRD